MTAREQHTETWKNTRGEAFRIVGWRAPAPTQSALIIHHGLGEHAGRYETFARHLADAPFHIFSFDARGHGASVGKRGDAAGLPQLAADLDAILPALIKASGAQRIILMGHSMGAATVAQYLTTHTPHAAICGVVLSAPPVMVDRSSLGIKLKLAAASVLRKVAPSLTLANELDTAAISSVPAEVKRYLDDPQVHDRLSVQLGWSIVNDGEKLRVTSKRITSPTLVYQGLDDGIVMPAGTRELFNNLGAEDRTFHEYPGARHEVHHETPETVSRLFADLRAWLDAHLS